MSEEQNLNPQNIHRKSSAAGKLLWFVNIFSAFFLGISYIAPYASPDHFWYIAFFGLGYPILLIINFLFVLLWLFRTRSRFLLSLTMILAGWPHLQTLVQFNFKSTPSSDTSMFKVMTYNVRLFDLYNWTHNKETRNKIFDLLVEESPDVLCLQEFYVDDTGDFPTLDTLTEFLKAKNYHVEYTTTIKGVYHWGMATFSKFPIVNKGKIVFNTESNNICIFSDLKIGKDTVRIYNMHLQSVHFNNSDYQFIDEVLTTKKEGEIAHSKNIIRLLKRGFVRRAEQVNLVEENINNCKLPIIACGDFNDTPTSYVYHTLTEKLEDTFVESGYGLGRSYDRRFLTSVRIDYILKSPVFESFETRTIKEKLSDHYPVTCYLNWKK